MLRVTTIYAATAGPSARYYTRYLSSDGIEEGGVWLGRQADGLGLRGEVATDDLEALLSGCDPANGQQLGSPLHDRYKPDGTVVRAVAGFDATFSAPKELSILWAATGDDGYLEAHDVAVRAALAHVERYGSTTRVRTKAGRQHPDTGGLTIAAFRQVTSREDDPQIHTHAVISTKVRTDDGRWLALDARYLKRKQAAIGHLYQAVLRAELTHRYGVAWGTVVKGQAPMLGVPTELIDAFSKRSEQIAEAVDDKTTEFRTREGRDPSAWELAAITREAAADTRKTKSGTASPNLTRRWADEAAALGWTPDRLLERVAGAARQARTKEVPTLTQAEVIAEVSTSSTWSRADVVMAIADLAPTPTDVDGSRWAAAIEAAADSVVDSCISLDPPALGAVRRSDSRSVWLVPSEPSLTTDEVLAEEERIVLFATAAHERAPEPSTTVDRRGLDVLQAEAAEAVAGEDDLVLVVGPAGAGKTTTMRAATDDLARQGRYAFGVAPTAKAAKVLHDETGMSADTLAKLLHEWRGDRPPRPPYRLRPGTTVVLDEAGMVGTGALDRLMQLAASQRWRLVLVGDPRQLHAVGRGGMFDELCRTGRIYELARIHRFKNEWEQRASLQLRAAKPEALDAYFDHGRVVSGPFDELAGRAARRWIEHTASGHTVALVAETNDHVDALNAAVQAQRRALGQVGRRSAPIGGDEAVSVGDIVVTRRNDRSIRTDRGEPIRNRERWRVDVVAVDGSLTTSHLGAHGRAILPTDYATQHVRLGYAATAHGHQGDTIDVGVVVADRSTTHRSLYVGATRGRDENQLFVVTSDLDSDAPRAVLEQVLTNDRADRPAVAQRRELAAGVPRPRELERDARRATQAATEARLHLREVREQVGPALQPVSDAERAVEQARVAANRAKREFETGAWWRRPGLRRQVEAADRRLADARGDLSAAKHAAAPHQATVHAAERRVARADHAAESARFQAQLERAGTRERVPVIERDLGIDVPGL